MEREAVSSSNLASVGYEEETSVLEVEFNSGRIYQYYDVPQKTHEELIGADSVGRYFNAHVRNSFPFQEM
ncbi:KTSC domain-containing protein [Polycladidibacter stylochi]|uniref:KTSC domain-containing protein n=1 Tax=Polycladidibacter stylochi TaxID=1807766 RepID=UPI0008340083